MLNAHIDALMIEYLHCFPQDYVTIAALRKLKADGADIVSRKEFLGHVTCGAIVVSDDGRVLMIHHRALDKWLFPGGHLEPGDQTLRGAAMRELLEEMGIDGTAPCSPGGILSQIPINIDSHPIPANASKREPRHQHFDFRFVFKGSPKKINLQQEEVCNWAWADRAQVAEPVRRRLMQFSI